MMEQKTNNIVVSIEVETKQLDTAIEKAKELVSLLERADKLIQSLGSTTINNYNN